MPRSVFICLLLSLTLLLAGTPAAAQQDGSSAVESDSRAGDAAAAAADSAADAQDAASAAESTATEAQEQAAELQLQLDVQQQRLEQLENALESLREAEQARQSEQEAQIAEQRELIDKQRQVIQKMQGDIDQLAQLDPNQLSDEEIAFRNRLETLEESISKSQEASSTTFDTESFPGSMPIPGTAAAIRIGGFVKANMAVSFDTIGSQDRFIVGSIPTGAQQSGDADANLTVSQSRLNFDLRDRTQLGVLRAFIEADFAGEGDVFRLRHAFGQFRDLLVGKTDSAFVDTEARPEELDFEGINGALNVRQAQIRFFPSIGKDLNLVVSLEDPNPDVTGGDGISQYPDVVMQIRRTWFERWHLRAGAILRKIQARWTGDPNNDPGLKDDTHGWGLTFSGRTAIRLFNERDNFVFQVNTGRGYGRYVNDLSSVGGQDAAFDDQGNLRELPVISGFVAFQHWWDIDLRSTFIASFVNVDTYNFQPGDAYNKTQRLSGNLIWSPSPRIDIGTELIYGKRRDKDDATGDALQWQVSAKYRF